jgi:3-(3-hydroxy-phenyl)propionate hydroxylase
MNTSRIYDVIISGYGPVGATLANLLAQQGLSVAILEREAGVYHLARAGHFDAEVMRVFQSIGIAQQLEPKCAITLGMRFLDADGALLMDWKRGGEKGPSGWVSDYMFHQPTLERILRARVAEMPGIDTYLQHDVYAIDDSGECVVVKAEDVTAGRLVALRGRYLVGCDGARSLVRRTIGTEQEDLGFKQRWLVIDVEENRDLGLERISIQHCNPERPMYASCTSDRMLRWEIMLKPGDDPQHVTKHDVIWDFIENSVRPISRNDGQITRSAVYTFESLIAYSWRKGRIIVAGDAAHRMPPFLGQGMCAGIRDAANLAWKLAAVCQGRAGDALLGTYETERRPHLKAFTEGAIEAGKFVQMSDPVALAQRVASMRANPKAYAPPNPALGPGLSSLYGEHGLGRQFVQPAVHGVPLDDVAGHAFALVGGAALVAQLDRAVLQRDYPQLKVIALADDQLDLLAPWEAPALLLRPDRYVHGAAQTAAEVMALLAALPLTLAPA